MLAAAGDEDADDKANEFDMRAGRCYGTYAGIFLSRGAERAAPEPQTDSGEELRETVDAIIGDNDVVLPVTPRDAIAHNPTKGACPCIQRRRAMVPYWQAMLPFVRLYCNRTPCGSFLWGTLRAGVSGTAVPFGVQVLGASATMRIYWPLRSILRMRCGAKALDRPYRKQPWLLARATGVVELTDLELVQAKNIPAGR